MINVLRLRGRTASLVFAAASLGIAGVASAADKISLKFATISAPNNWETRMMHVFATYVEQAAPGQFDVKVFDSGTLLQQGGQVQALARGTIEMVPLGSSWIVDALRRKPHPTHAHLDLTLSWITRARPARAVITNMHVDLDYATLKAELPGHTTPAFDGMTLTYDNQP